MCEFRIEIFGCTVLLHPVLDDWLWVLLDIVCPSTVPWTHRQTGEIIPTGTAEFSILRLGQSYWSLHWFEKWIRGIPDNLKIQCPASSCIPFASAPNFFYCHIPFMSSSNFSYNTPCLLRYRTLQLYQVRIHFFSEWHHVLTRVS